MEGQFSYIMKKGNRGGFLSHFTLIPDTQEFYRAYQDIVSI
jgi:hypothetical protein